VVAEALPDGRADVAEVGQQLLPDEVGQQLLPDEVGQAGQVEVDVDGARRLGGGGWPAWSAT
jgi:hypothetical protein